MVLSRALRSAPLLALLALTTSAATPAGASTTAPAAPRIDSVSVALPTTEDPAAPPSQRLVRVAIHDALPAGCPGLQGFRYANEDGNWQQRMINRDRPYFEPSPGYGYKGVYVQLFGTCGNEIEPHPIGNVAYTRYELRPLS